MDMKGHLISHPIHIQVSGRPCLLWLAPLSHLPKGNMSPGGVASLLGRLQVGVPRLLLVAGRCLSAIEAQ